MKKIVLNISGTEKQRRAIFAVAQATDFPVHMVHDGYAPLKSIEAAIKEYKHWEFLSIDEKGLSATLAVENNGVTLSEFLAELAKPSSKFVIELSYYRHAAVDVQMGKVQIGNDIYDLEKFRELVKKSDSILVSSPQQ